MLYCLGPVVFQLVPLNTDKVSAETRHPFAEHEVVGGPPLYENMGEGERGYSLKGCVFPEHFGGLAELAALRSMVRAGVPQHLMRGDGTPMGWVALEKISEESETLGFTGIGREITYCLDMKVATAPGAGALIDIIGGLLR
jgi:phage protein U